MPREATVWFTPLWTSDGPKLLAWARDSEGRLLMLGVCHPS